jgi:undecaprenyl-diphosphatase
MDLYQALVLGTVQGFVEWLPLSSQGINSLIMVNFFGKTFSEAAYLAIWLHIGTLAAAIVYFRKRIAQLFMNLRVYSFQPTYHNKLTNFLLISTFATGIVGGPLLLFGLDKIEFSGELATALIGAMLIVTGLLQLFIQKNALHKEPSVFDGFLVGLVQGFAGLPGLSRSGLTVSALLFRGYNAETALTLSFLMGIPVILCAEIFLGFTGLGTFDMYSVFSMAIAFVVGLTTIKLLMRLAKKINFGYFCVILGLLSILRYFLM